MSVQEDYGGILELLRKHRRHIHPAEAQLWLERGNALGGLLQRMSWRRDHLASPADRPSNQGPAGAEPA